MKYIKLFESFENVKYAKKHIEDGEEVYNYGIWKIEAKIGKKVIGYIEYDICNLINCGGDNSSLKVIPGEILRDLLRDPLDLDDEFTDEEYFIDFRLLWVEHSYRHLGIAEKLVNEMLKHANKQGIMHVILYAKPYNQNKVNKEVFTTDNLHRLINWYEKKFGFLKIKKIQKGYVMYLHLN